MEFLKLLISKGISPVNPQFATSNLTNSNKLPSLEANHRRKHCNIQCKAPGASSGFRSLKVLCRLFHYQKQPNIPSVPTIRTPAGSDLRRSSLRDANAEDLASRSQRARGPGHVVVVKVKDLKTIELGKLSRESSVNLLEPHNKFKDVPEKRGACIWFSQ